MLVSMVAMAVQAEQVVVRANEPRPASPWVEVFTARCGRQRLEIRRPMRPLQTGSEVRLNGRAARGEVRPLELELGEVGAAYRLSFVCSRQGAMLLGWVQGLAGEGGEVRYRSGSAEFRDGALVNSRAEEANAETFWYR